MPRGIAETCCSGTQTGKEIVRTDDTHKISLVVKLGQSITLSHLAPFVDVSRKKIRKQIIEEFEESGIDAKEEQIDRFVEKRLLREVSSGIQTIQYQVVTIMTTNGGEIWPFKNLVNRASGCLCTAG